MSNDPTPDPKPLDVPVGDELSGTPTPSAPNEDLVVFEYTNPAPDALEKLARPSPPPPRVNTNRPVEPQIDTPIAPTKRPEELSDESGT